MAIIEIRDILNNETGETIFPRTHVDAVIGLKDNSFFETVPDTQDPTKYSVKLKDEYTGLWADGWIAAGGIGTGSGGGGGLIQTVYTWDDIQEMSSSPEDDTTSAFNAKTVYEIYKMLQSGGLDGGGYLKESGGGFFLTSSSEKILLKGSGHSLSGLDDVSIYNPATNDLLTWSGYSWVNIPQSAVRPDMSGYVTVATFNETITGLQTQIAALENFFELDGYGNVTLKSPYQNLWVSGWLAAGGAGSGSGGGSQTLDDLLDVTISSSPSVGDALVYNGSQWVNGQVSGGGTVTDVTLGGQSVLVDSIATLPAYPTTLPASDVPQWAKQSSLQFSALPNLYIGTTSVQDSSASQALTGISSVKLSSSDSLFEWDNDNGAWRFHGNLYADGWVSAGGAGSGSGGGSSVSVESLASTSAQISRIAKITIDGTDTYLYNDVAWGTYDSSAKTIGVTINGTTWTVALNGYSSGGGGGGISQVTLAQGSTNGKLKLIIDDVSQSEVPVPGLGDLAFLSSVPDLSSTYVTLSGYQEIDGPKTFKTYDVTLKAVSLVPYSNNSASIGGDLQRFANIYGNNVHIGPAQLSYNDDGLALMLSGIEPMGGNNVGLKLNSFIDIGDARLEYDSDAYALRITKRAGYSRTIGLYADGFVAAGGTAASASRNIVFTDGTQTISGLKTFTNTVTLDGSGLDSGVNALNVTGTVSVNGNLNATTFGGGIVIEKDAQTYRHISVSDDRLYIQRSVSQDLVLCNGNSSHCVVGSYESPGTNKLYVNGTALATAWNTSSDFRLKDDITALSKEDAIEKLMALKPSVWKWNSGLAKGHTASGFIAQEVESVLPFMVTGEDYKGLSYQMLHAYEVSAIQSHEERISALEKKILTD